MSHVWVVEWDCEDPKGNWLVDFGEFGRNREQARELLEERRDIHPDIKFRIRQYKRVDKG